MNQFSALSNEKLTKDIRSLMLWFRYNHEYVRGFKNPSYNGSTYGKKTTLFRNMVTESRKRGLKPRLLS